MSKPDPVLPAGNASILSGISENFSFHASPESFITSAILRYHELHPERVQKRTPVRAKILNRNVAIVSAYDQVKQVLQVGNSENADLPYVAAAPYMRLMADSFPQPNLLLEDGCPHQRMRLGWEESIREAESESEQKKAHNLVSNFISKLEPNVPFDLYKALKDLAWQLFLSRFLQLDEDDDDYLRFVKLQEDLLRGQFSLFPVSLNTGFWHSPRKRGIDARKKLQQIIATKLESQELAWLPRQSGETNPKEELVNHILMATSSLAAKGFASLLLAFLLNVYLHEGPNSALDLDEHRGDASDDKSGRRAVLLETLRLSPPIAGIMRRATSDRILASNDNASPDTLLPSGWDVWTYFPGANRDPAIFGDDADLFRPSRYLSPEDRMSLEPIAFGLGSKRCLGATWVEKAALTTLAAFEAAGIKLEGEIGAPGVRGWLGWQVAAPEEWANDMKQLPTQRPSKPIMVRIVRKG